MPNDDVLDARARCDALAREWRVSIERSLETASSVIAFGRRSAQPVVLKVLRLPGDEWRSGEVLRAFDGRGAARVYEHTDGALLLERLEPADSLAEVASGGRDDVATVVLAGVMRAMSPSAVPPCPTVGDWGKGFQRYTASGDASLPWHLVSEAATLYERLCESQTNPRLLHGDLQHHNVLRDDARGWVAIDPKGVIGEIEYETGAALRNPVEHPALLTDRATIERRASIFASTLGIDPWRVLAWALAQAVLSAIWDIEDGLPVADSHPSLLLARAIRPMLARAG
ncbi:MAG TPA: aminoglycoside phosphotransferase family protein [Gemmatimonadaceae bacterium]|nr:aminoglycoside phosphotransferase family protein [Gemmatimonadaceae bacterium]